MSSVVWTSSLHGASLVIDIALASVLARMLTPAEFGVVAAALIFIQFSRLLYEVGVGPTLVQMKDVTVADQRTGLTLVLIVSSFIFLAAQVLAPFVERGIRIDGVAAVFRWLSMIILMQGLATVSESLLVRALAVRKVMLIELSSKVLGSAFLAITLASLGFGYWALVFGTLAEAAIRTALLIFTSKVSLMPMLNSDSLKRLLGKGSGFTASKFLNFIAVKGDNFVVARYLDAAHLGVYSRAYNLMSLPAELYNRIAERVVFPALAKIQQDQARLRSAFMRGHAVTALIGMPLSVIVFILAPEIVEVLLGRQWRLVTAPFAILAFSMYLRLGARVSGSLLRATGALKDLVVAQGVYAVLVIGGCLMAYRQGLPAVAMAVNFAVLVWSLIITWSSLRSADATWTEFARAHTPGLILSVGVLVVEGVTVWICRQVSLPALATLICSMVVLAAAALPLIIYRPRAALGSAGLELLDYTLRLIPNAWLRRRLSGGAA